MCEQLKLNIPPGRHALNPQVKQAIIDANCTQYLINRNGHKVMLKDDLTCPWCGVYPNSTPHYCPNCGPGRPMTVFDYIDAYGIKAHRRLVPKRKQTFVKR